jgi:hypothetical protein
MIDFEQPLVALRLAAHGGCCAILLAYLLDPVERDERRCERDDERLKRDTNGIGLEQARSIDIRNENAPAWDYPDQTFGFEQFGCVAQRRIADGKLRAIAFEIELRAGRQVAGMNLRSPDGRHFFSERTGFYLVAGNGHLHRLISAGDVSR